MSLRFRLILVTLGALLVAATFTFPRWQHLFTNTDIQDTDVILTNLDPELRPTFEALPLEQQTAYREFATPDAVLDMINSALLPPVELPEIEQSFPSMSGAVEIALGSFSGVDIIREANGSVHMYEQAEGSKVLRFEEFGIVNGPDLHVILSASPQPQTSADMRLNNLDLDLGALKANLGSQNYDVPSELRIDDYHSVVIYSQSLDLIYAYATLYGL
jgi:hypothetical protein